jgi:hypothetical protein
MVEEAEGGGGGGLHDGMRRMHSEEDGESGENEDSQTESDGVRVLMLYEDVGPEEEEGMAGSACHTGHCGPGEGTGAAGWNGLAERRQGPAATGESVERLGTVYGRRREATGVPPARVAAEGVTGVRRGTRSTVRTRG